MKKFKFTLIAAVAVTIIKVGNLIDISWYDTLDFIFSLAIIEWGYSKKKELSHMSTTLELTSIKNLNYLNKIGNQSDIIEQLREDNTKLIAKITELTEANEPCTSPTCDKAATYAETLEHQAVEKPKPQPKRKPKSK